MTTLTASARFAAAHAAAAIFALGGMSYRSAFRRALVRVDGRDAARAYAVEQCRLGRAILAQWTKADGTAREMPCVVRSDSRDHPHLLPVTDLDTGDYRFVNLDTLGGFTRIDDPSELPAMPTAPAAPARTAPDRPAVPSPSARRAEARPRFPLGRTVATPGALHAAAETGTDLSHLIGRHHRGDWGDVSAADGGANDLAATIAARIVSCYTVGDERFWVITEADRSATTVLLPSEY